jgi:uncharacterized protein YjbI with pentapeptide repeats
MNQAITVGPCRRAFSSTEPAVEITSLESFRRHPTALAFRHHRVMFSTENATPPTRRRRVELYLRRYARIAFWLIGVIGAGFAAWAVLFLPEYVLDTRHILLAPMDRLSAEAAIRSSILQLIGGVILVAGLYFTARGFRLTRAGHITDRYAKSVEQLGHDNLDVRIGGIFALEKIAHDSRTDRQTVVEILTAFVREHTRVDPRTPKTEVIAADVQAALAVLGRRSGVEEERHSLNLYNCGLNDADLGNADLRRAMFFYSSLTGAVFYGSRLDDAGLSFCKAERGSFNGVSARGAHFVNAAYRKVYFINGDFTDADFYGCDLTGSDFGRRYPEEGKPPLPPAILTNARMTKARLENTNLRGVDLSTVRGLEQDQLSAAITDANTIMPTHWGGGEDEYE